jgi:site-specific DNA-methyltransferase (adenine-specific)
MDYIVKDIINKYEVSIKNLNKFLEDNSIDVKNGAISDQSFRLFIDYFDNIKDKRKNGSTIDTLIYHELKQDNNEGLRFISDDGSISIFQDDAISFLKKQPNNSVDLIVTDPAYSGMNQMLKLGRGKIIGKYSEKGDGQKWFDEFHDTKDNYETFLKECYRILKPNRHIYIMFDSFSLLTLGDLVRNVFKVKNILVWDKLNIGLGHYFRRRHEFILFASKGKRHLNSKNIPDVWRVKRITGFKYPTQKPTEIFELMLAGSAEKDYLVFDPFLGSGSSAIASIKNNCRFIGCDSAFSSIEISAKRIKSFLSTHIDILQPKFMCEDDITLKKILKKNGTPL